jgi:hypothetical protein
MQIRKYRMNVYVIGAASLLLITSFVVRAQEARAVPDSPCKEAPLAKGKSRQRFDATAFMVVAGELEAQGEKNFRLKYDPPAAECLVERFDVAGREMSAIYNPWEKGTQTLLYRFLAETPQETREVLVLYSGTAGLVAKGQAFHVTETRAGVVSFYAMFKEQPTYQAAKDLATSIFSASAKPLLAVRWPEGAKEGEIVAFNSSKLK